MTAFPLLLAALALAVPSPATVVVAAPQPAPGPAPQAASQAAPQPADPSAARHAAALAALDRDHGPRALLAIRELAQVADEQPERAQGVLALGRAADDPGADPEIRALARHRQAAQELARGNAQRGAALLARLGFVERWLLLGPFDDEGKKGLETAYPPERSIELAARLPGKVREVAWRAVPPEAVVRGLGPPRGAPATGQRGGGLRPGGGRLAARPAGPPLVRRQRPGQGLGQRRAGAHRPRRPPGAPRPARRAGGAPARAEPDPGQALPGAGRPHGLHAPPGRRARGGAALPGGRPPGARSGGAPLRRAAAGAPAGRAPRRAARPGGAAGALGRGGGPPPGPGRSRRRGRGAAAPGGGARPAPERRRARSGAPPARRGGPPSSGPATCPSSSWRPRSRRSGTPGQARLAAAQAAAPGDARVLLALAEERLGLERPFEAVRLLERAVAAAPGWAAARVDAGGGAGAGRAGGRGPGRSGWPSASGRRPRCRRSRRRPARRGGRAISIGPPASCARPWRCRYDDAAARASLARLLLARGDLDGAVALQAEAQRLDPSDVPGRLAAGRPPGGQRARARRPRRPSRTALRLCPEEAEAWERRGRARLRAGRTAEALADLRRAQELRPQDPAVKELVRSLEPAPRAVRGALPGRRRGAGPRPRRRRPAGRRGGPLRPRGGAAPPLRPRLALPASWW